MEYRQDKPLVTFFIIATGEYNDFMPSLLASAMMHIRFSHEFVIFTDQKENACYSMPNVGNVVEIPHLGWPTIPLLRFELFYKHIDKAQGRYIYSIDAEVLFVKDITAEEFIGERVGCLHRNIKRPRHEFNYENRSDSKACIEQHEGEQYFAGGLIGGSVSEFINISRTLSKNIRYDIKRGLRARWGDESHINRYFIDNPPTLILTPNFMCPENNKYFIPFIIHRDKTFKEINIKDTDRYLEVNPKDYENIDNWT